MGEFVFIGVAFLVIITAVLVVTTVNLVHSAVALMGTLFGIAALYIFLYADFIAAVQVIVYVGGILVLIIFGVMLTQKIDLPVHVQTSMPTRAFAAFVNTMLFILLTAVVYRTPWHTGSAPEPDSTVAVIGNSLMTKYLLHFEVAGLLLLLALLGATYLSRREENA